MDLQHITVKLYRTSSDFDESSLIPVFHDWIQRNALPDLLVIDVADYTHIENGQGVMLICHEGQYSLDSTDGRPGLVYANKRLATGSVQDRLRTAIHRTLTAAQLLEAEPVLNGALSFASNELMIRFDDHLLVPNSDEGFDSVRDAIEEVLKDTGAQPQRLQNEKGGLAISIALSSPPGIKTLADNFAPVSPAQ